MKKSFCFSLVLFALLLNSCSKFEQNDITKLKAIEIVNSKFQSSNDLLIFSDLNHFYNTLEDYYSYSKEYHTYFSQNNSIKSPFYYYQKVISNFSFDSHQTRSALLNDLEPYLDLINFTGDEILPKFSMDYMNLFFNLHGEVKIGKDIHVWKNGFVSIVPENEYVRGMSLLDYPKKDLKLIKKLDIRSPSGVCIDESGNRRIKCRAELHWDSHYTNGCFGKIIDVATEADAKYQRKVLGIWWNVKAKKIWIDYFFQIKKNNWFGPVVFTHDYTNTAIDANKVEIKDFERFCTDAREREPIFCISNATFDNYALGYLDYNCEISLNNGGCQYIF